MVFFDAINSPYSPSKKSYLIKEIGNFDFSKLKGITSKTVDNTGFRYNVYITDSGVVKNPRYILKK